MKIPGGATATARGVRIRHPCRKLLDYCSLVQYIFIPPEQFHTVVQYDTPDQGTPAVLEGSTHVRARRGCA
jgi:hypothetical protein